MKKIDWTNHLIEFITVVIGIGLAFALNNWNESINEKKQAVVFLESIKSEIETNLKEVEEKYEYHIELLENLIKKPAETNLTIKPSRLEDYAWQMANNNVFKQHTDFSIYKSLAKIYSIQDGLKHHNMQAVEMMAYINVNYPYLMLQVVDKEFDETAFHSKRRKGWISIFQDMNYYESLLIKLYKKALNE